MTYQDDYNKFADIRDEVIKSLIPESEREDITGTMRSVELALIATEPGKTMKVTRDGTEMIELYIRYLEREVFNVRKLSIKTGPEIFSRLIKCPRCEGNRYINQQVKKKRVPVQCPDCKGEGKVRKDEEIENA